MEENKEDLKNEDVVVEEVVIFEDDATNNNDSKDTHTEYKKGEEHSKNKSADSNNDRIWYSLAYAVFFLPLIMIPHDGKGKFHANQGLILLLASIVGRIVLGIIPFIGWMLMPLFGIFMFILFIIGVINGFNEKQKPLPVIGNLFSIIK